MITSLSPVRWILVAWLLGLTPLLRADAADLSERKWVPAWVSAQQLVEPHNLPPAPGLAGHTLRQIIQPKLAGTRARIVVSNEYGEAPLVLGAATLARSAGASAIEPASAVPLTFDGRSGTTVLPGTYLLSDEVEFAVEPFENLAVSLFVEAAPSEVTGHPGSRTTSYLVADEHVEAPALPEATPVERWYLLAQLQVWAEPEAAAVVVIGDSITDGRGSTTDENNRWPDLLARRLAENPATRHLSVLNQGAGGGRVLRDGLGTSALGRFDRDVLAIPGARWLIVFAGVNDLGTAVGARRAGQPHATTEDLISAYQQMIRRAHSHGIKVIGATIMPFGGFEAYDTPESEAARQRVNEWIRTAGAFDAVIDFDALTRDPEQPSRLAAEIDGGDRLHPSAAGYRRMSEAIDLSIFD